MSELWLVLGLGVGLSALRLTGLLLPDAVVPAACERVLGFVPVAVLTALVVASLTAPAEGGVARYIAAVGAALVARRTGRIWACILSGLALYWLLQAASTEGRLTGE